MRSLLLSLFPSFLAASDAFAAFDWGTVSATGLLGWYLWYTTKVVFPRLDEQTVKMQENCSKELHLQRAHYEALLTELQTRHSEEHTQITRALEKIITNLDKD